MHYLGRCAFANKPRGETMLDRKIALAAAAAAVLSAPAYAERLSMATPWPGGQWIESMERMSDNIAFLTDGQAGHSFGQPNTLVPDFR